MNENINSLKNLLQQILDSVQKDDNLNKYIDNLIDHLIKLREFGFHQFQTKYQVSLDKLIKILTDFINAITQSSGVNICPVDIKLISLHEEIIETNLNNEFMIMPSAPQKKENNGADEETQVDDGDGDGDGEIMTHENAPQKIKKT